MERMDKKSKLYVSLPISGHDMSRVRERCERARMEYGDRYDVITPIDLCGGDESLPYSWCMGRCVEALLECDSVVFLSGWETSRGCKAEYEIARIYGLSVIMDNSVES